MVKSNSQTSSSSSDPSSGNTTSSSDPSTTGSSSSTSGSSSGTVCTLPPVSDDGARDETDNAPQESRNWGVLTSLQEKQFPSCGLRKEQYVFGRGLNLDYVFDMANFEVEDQRYFSSLSSKHFTIFKECHSGNGKDDYTVFIEDLSSNGTLVNGTLIGRNKTKILNSGDEISLVGKKAFTFIDCGETDSQQQHYPKELTEKYTIGKVIGTGACGEVRLAQQRTSLRKFAVKIITKKSFSIGPKVSTPVLDEVRILRALDHPGIIKIEDFFDSEKALYIVLEFVRGGELFDKVTTIGKYDEKTSKILFYQMLLAVSYLHSNSITHRDLKPENILLATGELETTIKITDFGLSKIVGENSFMQTMCGTPNYLAPEILRTKGIAGYTKSVDCWSLGCILYICLAGYPPFSDGAGGLTIYDQIVKGAYSFPEKYWGGISEEAKDLIGKLLRVNAADRLSVDDALKHPWLQDEEMKMRVEELIHPKQNVEGPLRRQQDPPAHGDKSKELVVASEEMPPPHAIPNVRKLPPPDEEGSVPAKKIRKEV